MRPYPPPLRSVDVGAYLAVSHQRAYQMFRKGKLPEPEQVDGVGRPR
jgi:hypothetical protein